MTQKTLNETLVTDRSAAVLDKSPESKVVKAALDSVLTKLEVAVKAPKQKNQPLNEEQVLDTVQATSKVYQKTIEALQEARAQAQTQDAKDICDTKIAAAQAEQAVLAKYLPDQMSEAEIRVHVQAILQEVGITDIKQAGRVVGEFSKRHPKMADGKVVAAIAQELLSA